MFIVPIQVNRGKMNRPDHLLFTIDGYSLLASVLNPRHARNLNSEIVAAVDTMGLEGHQIVSTSMTRARRLRSRVPDIESELVTKVVVAFDRGWVNLPTWKGRV